MKLEYNQGILFVRLKGTLDHNISREINQLLIPRILEQRIKYLVFNMYEVTDIDNFGLEALLNAKCAIKTNKGKICLCELNDFLSRKLKSYRVKKTQNELNAINVIGEI